jgi:uncharacterized membrane protein
VGGLLGASALRSNENERLILFSDAIMAVTITLLALDIRLPPDAIELRGGPLLEALGQMWPKLFAYALSFFVIAMFWIAHRRKFDSISRSHPSVVWLNFLFLMLLGLIPFVTDVLAENGGPISTVLYATLVATISAILVIVSVVAEKLKLLGDDGEYLVRERAVWPSLATSAVFVASMPLALIESTIAQLFWLTAFPINTYLWGRWRKARQAHGLSSEQN